MQRMCFNGKYPQLRSINLSVPQGSVLGPLMFIIYMNKIASAIKECEYYLFADDTLLSVSGTTVNGEIKSWLGEPFEMAEVQ
jgi:hypothetical protein